MALQTDRKTQARTCYEVLTEAGYRAFIGTKPHNSHVVSVFTTAVRSVHDILNRAIHSPRYEVKKIKGKNVIMLYFRK